MAALSLAAYAVGLPAFIAVKVLAPGFYARQDTKTPVKIAITAMVSNMLLNLVFVGSLLAIDFRGPHTGLALASSVAAYINAGLLYRMLRRQEAYRPEPGWARVWLAVLAGSAAMTALLLWQVDGLADWADATAGRRAARLTLLVGGGAVVYALGALLGGLRPRFLAKGAA
jgi:putative peptidoglycan lipid II flippase